jgi:lysophospholipase L1-like esterase
MTEGQNGALLPGGLFILDVRQIVVESESYPVRLQRKLRDRYTAQTITVSREGIGGELTSSGLSRLPGVLQKDQPEMVLLLEGANDLNTFQLNGVAPAVANMDAMVKLCHARGLRVMLAGLPPQRAGGTPPRGNSGALVTPYNNALRVLAQANGVEFIDTEGAFAGDLTLLGPDGLHPNAAGYERMAQAFHDRIVAKYEVPTASIKAQRRGAEVAEDVLQKEALSAFSASLR